MAQATGKAGSKSEDWESLSVRKADAGGFIISKCLPYTPGKMMGPDPKPMVFTGGKEAADYVEACILGKAYAAEEKSEKKG